MEKLNVYQKLIEVKKVAEGFSKDSKSYGYEYVSGNQILHKIRDKMNEVGLLLIPSSKVSEYQIHKAVTSKGKAYDLFLVSGEMTYSWVNADDGESIEVPWAYYGGQDDISKAYGSALTYSERYFLLKSLGLPTDEDDPDDKKNTDPDRPANIISQAQLKRLYAIALSKGQDLALVKKAVKKDYNKEIDELNKTEYDAIVSRLEKIEEGK